MQNKKKKRRISKEQQKRNERQRKFQNKQIKDQFEARTMDPFAYQDVPRKTMVNEPKLLDSKVKIPKRLKKIKEKSKVRKFIDEISGFKLRSGNKPSPAKLMGIGGELGKDITNILKDPKNRKKIKEVINNPNVQKIYSTAKDVYGKVKSTVDPIIKLPSIPGTSTSNKNKNKTKTKKGGFGPKRHPNQDFFKSRTSR